MDTRLAGIFLPLVLMANESAAEGSVLKRELMGNGAGEKVTCNNPVTTNFGTYYENPRYAQPPVPYWNKNTLILSSGKGSMLEGLEMVSRSDSKQAQLEKLEEWCTTEPKPVAPRR